MGDRKKRGPPVAAIAGIWTKRPPLPDEQPPGPGLKRCVVCRGALPLDDFNTERCRPDGKSPRCRKCVAELRAIQAAVRTPEERARRVMYAKQWKETSGYEERRRQERSTPEGRLELREKQLNKRYGMSHEDYERKLGAQNGRCACCDRPLQKTRAGKSPHIDHCHATGRVRGILCVRCNNVLGMVKDSEEMLGKFAHYIRKHKERH